MIARALLLMVAATGVANAQSAPVAGGVPDKVDQLIVYDDADCPEDTDDTLASCIVVTGESPYRIPSELRVGPPGRRDETAAKQALILLKPVSGQGSGSASGAGSMYGSSGNAYADWKADRREGQDAYYAGLIAQARAKRLGLIDEEAEVEQAVTIDATAPDAAVVEPD